MRGLYRPAWLAIAALLAAVPAHAAQPDNAGPQSLAQSSPAQLSPAQLAPAQLSLAQLMATLNSVRHVEARYIEHRTLQALRTPLETRGTLRFEAPDRLEQVTDPGTNGVSERMTIKGNQLTIDRGAGRAPVVLAVNEHPEIGLLVDSIRALLSGDGEALRRTFDITPSGTLSHWQLVLQPRDPARPKMLLWMRVTGYGARITGIDTQQGNGDHSEMSIVEQAQ
jgi:hypothetical protein